MFFIIPAEVETLQQETTWSNKLIIGVSSVLSLYAIYSGYDSGSLAPFILDGFSITGLLGHSFLHADLFHLIGNMLFLWVFGNAICTNIGNWMYLAVYASCALVAALFHIMLDGSLAVGASGAINGIVGVTLAMYPKNRIHMFWLFLIRTGTFPVTAWHIISIWLLFDIWGALSSSGNIAYWAHIGGLLAGVSVGVLALHKNWIQLTKYDNSSLLDILRGKDEDAF